MADRTGSRPRMLVAKPGRSEVVQMLLTRGEITLNIPGFDGQILLCHASQDGKLVAMYQLLLHQGINLNKEDSHYQILLFWAD